MTTLPFTTMTDVAASLHRVEEHLEKGGLLAYPTETVYGMGSRVNESELAALADLTNRPPNKPFLLLVAGQRMARECGLHFSDAATALADRYWPGPLTLVLSARESKLPRLARSDGGGIAVRLSSHQGTSHLIKELDMPLSSTSANRSGKTPLKNVSAIREEFSLAVDSDELMLLDGGMLEGASPSTLVDCTTPTPRILREGALPSEELRRCLGELLS